jgi:solute carrier family 12 (sodium/potassium/chloride transporter), member 2
MDNTAKKQGYAFGTFQGVYTPSILTILGVVMYLRFGWVLGNVGLLKTLLIVTMSTAITFITALSISTLATNMKVGGGGAYYIISRSLGIEAGAAIGLPLFFARAIGVAFYIAGFSEAVASLGVTMDQRLISLITLASLTLLASISADLALKSQYFIMAAIVLSLISFLAGSTPDLSQLGEIAPQPRESFWVVFAIFFPAVTGIEAGLGMSGDLKNPAESLPKGTLAAVITGYIIYMLLPIALSLFVRNSDILIAYPNIIQLVARWGSLIIAGVFAATLSSALGSMLGAPRTLQALANDRILPRFLARGFGKEKADPRIATAVSFVVALAAILLGDLNLIAPILSMFFLTSYGLLNLSAGIEGLIEAPSWRPKFKTPYWISLLGAACCFAVMLMINPGATILSVLVTAAIYYYIKKRRLNAHWSDMRYGILMQIVRFAIHRLNHLKPDERTWRPNILALSGSPKSRWHLIEMASALTHHDSALTVASVLPVEDWSSEKVQRIEASMREYLQKRNAEAMVKVFPAASVMDGAKALVRAYGFGPLTPNTILLGDTEKEENFRDISELIQLVNRTRRNLIMLRNSNIGISDEADSIDVWWGGDPNNIGLILTLAYQIQKSPIWKESNLKIKTIVNSEEERHATIGRLQLFIDEQRIPATAEVFLKDDPDLFSIIRKSSHTSGLVFMGMRPPAPEESLESYTAYYAQLIQQTKNMPSLALVLAAEPIEFRRVIGMTTDP